VNTLVVVDNPKRWPLDIPNAWLISSRAYLTDRHYSELRNAKVFNLCRSYRYQSTGYYVSLLAMARGHKPIPSISTIQDLKSSAIIRLASEELEETVERSLRPIQSNEFKLSIYFGRNVAKRYEALAMQLFRMFPAPLILAEFVREEDGWRIRSIRPMPGSEIPDSHRSFVIESATEFFKRGRTPAARTSRSLYDVAILHNPKEVHSPSNDGALKKFVDAGHKLRLGVDLIEKDDYASLAEYDGLFIRETTAVNHHTYRFARRAAAEGLVVIDDPDSITKCANKVYLAELLERHNVPTPKTVIVHRDNTEVVGTAIGLPCVLKQPDSSFSVGVEKVETREELTATVERLLEKSDLIIAQEFTPTDFDWRVTVLASHVLFACRYHMAAAHWQIRKQQADGSADWGDVEVVPVDQAPPAVIRTAVRAAKLIGDGLYGVDLKQIGKKVFVIEVNDNPNIDAGNEDRILKDELYLTVMRHFLDRISRKKNGKRAGAK